MELVSYYAPSLRIGLRQSDGSIVDLRRAYELQLLLNERDTSAADQAAQLVPADMGRFASMWSGRVDALVEPTMALVGELDSDWLAKTGILVDPSTVRLLPPVVSPTKIVNVGNSYLDHIYRVAEIRNVPKDQIEIPEEVKVAFFKPGSCLLADGEELHYSKNLLEWDFEAELAIIMGRTAAAVPEDEAEDYIFGYAVFNDASIRGVPARFGSNTAPLGKGADTMGPLGPVLVPREHLDGDPNKLAIRSWVNGEIRQDSNTDQLLWPIAEMVSAVSRLMTLYPGDIIATGSPAGMGLEDGRYLKTGDVVRIEIEAIGTLENRVGEPSESF